MSFIVRAAGESLSADKAVITKLASVKLHMLFQVAFLRKLLVTFFTLKLLVIHISNLRN